MSRGTTLPELVITVCLAGLVLGIAAPRLAEPLDTLTVEHAAAELAGAHARARVLALVESRLTRLVVSPDSLVLEVQVAGAWVRRWSTPGPARFDVAMAGGTHTLTYSPVGWTTGLSNASWSFTKGAASRRVVVSRLGRLRIER